MEENQESSAAIVERLARTGVQQQAGDTPLLMLPDNFSLESLERYLPQPTRIRGKQVFSRAGSFITYVNDFVRNDDLAKSRLYVDEFRGRLGGSFPGEQRIRSITMNCILDDPAAHDAPQHRDHSAHLELTVSDQFLKWLAINDRPLSHGEIVEFLDDNVMDILDPEPGRMMEIIQNFSATKQVSFHSGSRLDSGDIQFQFTEETTAKGNHVETFPGSFSIGVPIFPGDDPYRMEVLVRYTLREGSLRMRFVIRRPELYVEDAADRKLEEIHKATGLAPLFMA